MTLRIPPLTHQNIAAFLSNRERLVNLMQGSPGPVQILFPAHMDENAKELQSFFEQHEIQSNVSFAHKANKSSVFAQQARNLSIHIDVASLSELHSALESGFAGAHIQCTGIKTRAFLTEAIQRACTIVVDSIHELKQIEELALHENTKVQLLLRIADPLSNQKQVERVTRFGIVRERIPSILDHIRTQPLLQLKGFHFHIDEYTPEIKAGYVQDLITLMQLSYKKGLSPDCIDIGGGFRFPLVDEAHVDQIVSDVESCNFEQEAYGKKLLGLSPSRNGKVSKVQVLNKINPKSTVQLLDALFDPKGINNSRDTIRDSCWQVIVEPGYALLNHCGIIIVEVIGTKEISNGEQMVMVNGNMYNLSTQMKVWVTDPLLVSKKDDEKPWTGFVGGNLCKEDDILLDRRVNFPRTPKEGDYLVFVNTAGYTGGFEDASAIKQPMLTNVVALQQENDWLIISEKEYLERRHI